MAEQLGVSRNTLLRWFREGRVSEVGRDFRGWRVFRPDDVERIRRELGQHTAPEFGHPKLLRQRKYLQSVPLFRKVPEQALYELAHCARFQGMLAGQLLFAPGQPAHGLHILVKGRVRLFQSGAEGREQTLAVLTPFQTLGEAEIFRQNNKYSSYALCQTSSTVMTFPQARIRALSAQYPELAFAFLGEFAGRIQQLEQRLGGLALMSVEQRLVRLLLDWAGPKTTLTLPMKMEELASLLGAARESLSRTLNGLERRKLLARNGQDITLLDKRALEDL